MSQDNTIDVNEYLEIREKMRKWNRLDFDDLEFIYDGESIELDPEEAQKFKFMGLLNTDFIGVFLCDKISPEDQHRLNPKDQIKVC